MHLLQKVLRYTAGGFLLMLEGLAIPVDKWGNEQYMEYKSPIRDDDEAKEEKRDQVDITGKFPGNKYEW